MLSAFIAILVLIIELIVVWFHTLIDESLDNSGDSLESQQESGIPSGISGPLWENRHILFNARLPMDERAFQLVRRGFDVEEVFRLVELVTNGEITPQTRAKQPTRKIHTTPIILCGQVINLRFDRDSLSRTFARPASYWHLLSSVILAFLLSITSYLTSSLFQEYVCWYVALICTIALFSLLNPPPCDPYSTSFYDPYIAYTRAAIAVSLFGTSSLMRIVEPYFPETSSLANGEIVIHWSVIIDLVRNITYYAGLLYPALILLGFVGHPLTTIHWLLETLNKYIFGINGSTSLYKAFINFITSAILAMFVSIFLLIGNQVITIAVTVTVITFFIQFSMAGSCHDFLRKHLLPASVSAAASGGVTLLNYLFPDSWDVPLMYAIAAIHFMIDIAFPYLTTYQRYFFVDVRLIAFNSLTKYAHYLTNFVTGPLFLSIALIKDDIFAVAGALLLIHALRIAQTLPHLFCLALIMTMFFFRLDLGFENYSSSMMLSLIAVRKLVKLIRASRVWFKFRMVPQKIFTDPSVDPPKYIASCAIASALCYMPSLTSSASFPAFAWTILSGSPMSVFLGIHGLYIPSPPRPNSFYDYVSPDNSHDEYRNAMFDHPLEGPIYMSLANALQENLARMVKNGNLGLVNDDSFFLLINNDLMAIVHIIQVEANKVSFQLRGLEYIHQTLCHGGELSALQQIEMEIDSGPNIGLANVFKHAVFELRAKNIELSMLMMSQVNLQESIVDISKRGFILMWMFYSIVYGALKRFRDEEIDTSKPPKEYPEDFKYQYNSSHTRYISETAEYLGFQLDDLTLRRLYVITHIINRLIDKNTNLKVDLTCDFFDNKIDPDPILQGDEEICVQCLRFAIAVILMATVMAPTFESTREIFEFLNSVDMEHREYMLKSEEMENCLKNLNEGLAIISLIKQSEGVNVIRFEKGPTKWTAYELESEMIRGFWANEARSILFFAMSSRERRSIQFDVQSLRNITNQSCNQPIGYPAYVTDIIDSTYDPYD